MIIAYDGDVARKESVGAAMDALGQYLTIKGASVHFLHLPDEDEKVGLDDFLMAHSVDELWALVKPIKPRANRQDTRDDRQAEPPKEPPAYGSIDGATLLDDVRAWFARFICVVDVGDLDILTLWCAHTYLARELYTTPRLLITSPVFESGKTTLLEHLQHLCLNPIPAATINSEALLPRMLEQSLHTILLDEVNRTLRSDKPGVEDLLAVINSGYRFGAVRPVLMPAGNGEWQVRKMSTFAPVAMAGNSPNLPDDTMSRALRILMLPDIEDLSEESDWEFIEGEARQLATRLADWAESVRTVIKETAVDLPKGCTRRARERWRPLKRVAVAAGGGWPDVTDVLIVANLAEEAAMREDGLRARPPGLALLADLHEVWPVDEHFAPKKFTATRDLVHLLIAHDPDYWGADSAYGKELTEQRFGRLMSTAAKLTSQRPGGSTSLRGFLRVQLESAWRRLGIASRQSDENDTPPPQAGRTGQAGQTGDQDECGSGPAMTGLTGLTGSTGSNEGAPQNAEFCWGCGTELTDDELTTNGDYCHDCTDGRNADGASQESPAPDSPKPPDAHESRYMPPENGVQGSSDE